MNNIARSWIRRHISKVKRHSLIERYVRWEYWYIQGLQVVSSFKLTSVVELLGIIAFCKYFFGDPPYAILIIVAVVWIPLRSWGYWALGRFWHDGDGYTIQTQWNKGKVPPGRTEVINADELALRIARYSRMGREEFDKNLKRIEGEDHE